LPEKGAVDVAGPVLLGQVGDDLERELSLRDAKRQRQKKGTKKAALGG